MNKKVFAVLMVLAVFFSSFPLAVYALNESDVLIYENDGEGIKIIGCDDSVSGSLEIPSEIEGLPVTEIGESAFEECESLTEIIIPDTVKVIGEYAFCGCISLSSVIIGGGVTSIGQGAFWGTGLYFDDWDGGVLYIGDYLIEADFTLAGEYEIKDGTVLIADWAFAFTDIADVIIPASVKSIGAYAFIGCETFSLVRVPDTVSSIGEFALGYTFDDEFSESLSDGFILLCGEGGAAEAYAIANGIEYYTGAGGAYIINATDATCTEDGYTGDLYDPDADEIIKYGEVIPALNHSFARRINIVSPTAQEEGYTGDLYCPRCKETLAAGEAIPKIPFEHPEIGVTAERVDDTIEVTVSLPPVTGLSACVLGVGYDSSAVTIEDRPNYAATRMFEGEEIPYFSGIHEGGAPVGSDNFVINAFVSTSGVNKSSRTPFAKFVFDIIDPNAVQVVFKVRLNEYEDIDCVFQSGDCVTNIIGVSVCGHNNIEITGFVEPTCTEDGYSGDLVCLDCEEVLYAGEILEKTGHIESEWIVDFPATFRLNGQRHTECEFCEKEMETQAIPKVVLNATDVNLAMVLDGFETGLLACRTDRRTANSVVASFKSGDIAVFDTDGNPVGGEAYTGTGYEVRLLNGGETIDILKVVVIGDVNSDGAVGVDDARKTLRVAVNLEDFGDNPYVFLAADVAHEVGKIGVSDARKILRVAVGLEKF